MGAPDALIPGRPPLTRYKRELVVAAEEAAAAAGYGGGGGGKGKKGDVPGIAWLPPLGATGGRAVVAHVWLCGTSGGKGRGAVAAGSPAAL